MKNHIFKLKDTQYFYLNPLLVSIEEISFMNKIEIFLHKNKSDLLIGYAWSSEILDNLINILPSALNNQLIFNESNYTSPAICIDKYMIPEELHSIAQAHAKKMNRCAFVDTLSYLVCTTKQQVNPELSTWIYNDKSNNIIFEIGEQFTWPELPEDIKFKESDPIVFNFFKFIDNYTPIMKMIIPHSTAAIWLTQVRELLETMNYNEVTQCADCMANKHNGSPDNPVVHMRETK